MKTNPVGVLGLSVDDGMSDGDLLRACSTANQGAAFEELIRRHGKTVFAICRGTLGDGPDADDAFQATFLVLLQKAATIQQPATLSAWLCGVACRVARRMRKRRATVWAREKIMSPNRDLRPNDPPTPPFADPAAVALDRETRAMLWAEVGELPDKYRDPLVLCYLEDLTTDKAAEALNCPVGTLRSRLLKARGLLHSRLLRRGVTVSLAMALAGLGKGRADAAPAPELIRLTTTSARGGGEPRVTRIVSEVGREMTRAWQSKVILTGILITVLIGFGLLSRQGIGFPDPFATEQKTPPIPPGGGTLLVVSQQEANVFLIDLMTGKNRATISTDPCPHEIAVSPSGKIAAVSNYGLPFGVVHGSTVTLIDVRSGRKLKTVEVGATSAPHGLFWLDENRLLCTVEKTQALVEIDTTKGTVARRLNSEQLGTHMVVAAPTKRRVYSTNVLSGTVTAYDLATGTKLRDRPVGNMPEGLAISPDGKQVWIGNRGDNTLTVVLGDDLSVLKTLRAPGMPQRLAFAPDGKTVAVAQIQSGELALFDAATMTEKKRVTLSGGEIVFNPPSPQSGPAALAFSADGKIVYCTMFQSRAVAVVDVVAGVVRGQIPVDAGAIDGIAFSPVRTNETPDNPKED